MTGPRLGKAPPRCPRPGPARCPSLLGGIRASPAGIFPPQLSPARSFTSALATGRGGLRYQLPPGGRSPCQKSKMLDAGCVRGSGCGELPWGRVQAINQRVRRRGDQEVYKDVGIYLERASLKISSRGTRGHVKKDSTWGMEEVACQTQRAVPQTPGPCRRQPRNGQCHLVKRRVNGNHFLTRRSVPSGHHHFSRAHSQGSLGLAGMCLSLLQPWTSALTPDPPHTALCPQP